MNAWKITGGQLGGGQGQGTGGQLPPLPPARTAHVLSVNINVSLIVIIIAISSCKASNTFRIDRSKTDNRIVWQEK